MDISSDHLSTTASTNTNNSHSFHNNHSNSPLFPGLEYEPSARDCCSPASLSSSSYINPSAAISASDEQLQEIVRQFLNAQELPELQLELFGTSSTNAETSAVTPSSPLTTGDTSLPPASTLTLPSFLLPTVSHHSPAPSSPSSPSSFFLSSLPSSPSSSSSRKRKHDKLDSFDIAFAIAASHLTDATTTNNNNSKAIASGSSLPSSSDFEDAAFAFKSLRLRPLLPPPPPPLPLDVAAKRRKTNDVSASYKPTTLATSSDSSPSSPSSASPTSSSSGSSAASSSRQQRQNTTKMNHNRSERERRQRINDSIDELRDLLPPQCREIATNKLAILQESVGYMRHLKDSIERIQHERVAADEAYRNLYDEYRALRHYLSVYEYSDPSQLHVQHSVLPPFHHTASPQQQQLPSAAAAAHHAHLSHHHGAGSPVPSPGASPAVLAVSPASDPSILSVPASSHSTS